ncbi:MAG: ABC transporter permease, partial [Pseudomonadota bacterium]
MRYPVSFFVGLRYTITRNRSHSVSFISAIAMTGIILGVALLITVLSVMNGFDKELRERILSIMPQVTLYYSSRIPLSNSDNWQTLRQASLGVDGVEGATPFVELQAMLHQGKVTQPVLVYGVHGQLESSVSEINRYLAQDTLTTLAENANAIVLGQGLADKLDLITNDAVTIIVPRPEGSNRSPSIKRLRVHATFTTGTELDHSLALMGLEHAASLSNLPRAVSGLHVKVTELFAAPQIANRLISALPTGLYASDWTQTHGNLYHAIRMSKNLVSLLLFLIIAIAAFNVVSTLVMVVVDKRGDIAVLRTLGASDREIMCCKTFFIQHWTGGKTTAATPGIT